MLHGRGANEDDLLGLAEYLDDRFFIVSPRAPFPFEWGGGFTWYEVIEVGSPEPKMFTESYSKLSQFLDDVVKGYPIDPERIFLLGFSMGTMMAYSVLLTKPELIAGVVANSGYVPEETDLKFQWNKLHGKSLFIAHGIDDPVISVQLGRRAKELFSKTQADVTYKEYSMAHQISEESLSDFSHWLTERLDGHD
jgi:phospholipase/carboxylesterase